MHINTDTPPSLLENLVAVAVIHNLSLRLNRYLNKIHELVWC